jgi:hypothetical protein
VQKLVTLTRSGEQGKAALNLRGFLLSARFLSLFQALRELNERFLERNERALNTNQPSAHHMRRSFRSMSHSSRSMSRAWATWEADRAMRAVN